MEHILHNPQRRAAELSISEKMREVSTRMRERTQASAIVRMEELSILRHGHPRGIGCAALKLSCLVFRPLAHLPLRFLPASSTSAARIARRHGGVRHRHCEGCTLGCLSSRRSLG